MMSHKPLDTRLQLAGVFGTFYGPAVHLYLRRLHSKLQLRESSQVFQANMVFMQHAWQVIMHGR